ncbi:MULTISPECIES: hypothetical protein [Photorhabdus]|uniref:Uncharacterized protein n=2 Tax=Photorhabdus TaxID=29487 RepID=A0A7C9KJU3_9GAMM|nr:MULTISPECIES: hypothetical protein [Photorhabdus]MQL50105.1 hypothetical protein [Photorhabdus khanii]
MEISLSLLGKNGSSSSRYMVSVDKSLGLKCDYIVEFRTSPEIIDYLSDYYSDPQELNNLYMVDFFDLAALTDTSSKGQFHHYTDMKYTPDELETFFIDGIAAVIIDFVEMTGAKIIFSAPVDEVLARYYNRLLRKYAHTVNYVYREDIKDEVGFYVIETV